MRAKVANLRSQLWCWWYLGHEFSVYRTESQALGYACIVCGKE